MNATWFECKIRYEKMSEDGKIKKVNEPYLVDAVSFTDAETRISEEMKPYISGEYTISNIKRARYTEIIPNETGDRWFVCKVKLIIVDEEKGTEKKVVQTMLVQASDIQEALTNLNDFMKSSISDYEVPSIAESPILDYFPYEAKIVTVKESKDEQAIVDILDNNPVTEE